MLKVNNLKKRYGKLEVLKDVSFEIKKGSIYGFLGPNGAGKSTTMNIIAGLLNYQEGEINLNGKNYKKDKRGYIKDMGYLPQKPTFYNYMNAYEYLSFIGEINNLNEKENKTRIKELIELVGLKQSGNRKISGYSGGMKQRLGLAVALFHKPKMLLLDEPTASLDPEGRHEVLEFIKQLKSQGTTIFLSTHILNDIEKICDEVSILNKGNIILSDTLSNLKKDYIQPIFDIQFEFNPKDLKQELQKIKWIEKVTIDGSQVSIYVNDLEQAKCQLLKVLLGKNPIVSYKLRESNLEDIFIRMVKTNVNI